MSRTIFLFIRGVDQTGRAFGSAEKNLTNLQKKQRELLRSSYRLLFAGAAFSLFAVKASQGILNIMERTSQGALVVDDFRRSWGHLMDKLSEKFTEKATPWIDRLIKGLDYLTDHPWALDIIVSAGLVLTGAAIVGAITALGGAGLGLLGAGGLGILEKMGLGKALGSILGLPSTGSKIQQTFGAGKWGADSAPGALSKFAAFFGSETIMAPLITVGIPILLSAAVIWGASKLYGQPDVAEKIQEAINQGSLSTQAETGGLSPTDLMTEHGIQGIDYLSQGGAGDVLPMAGTYSVEINVDMHDNQINAEDADDVGTKVGIPIGDQLLNYIDRNWR